MSGKNVTLIVAAIGAFATLGAALISNWRPSKEQSPSLQQTASGAGAVNVGGNATITNNNIMKSQGEEAAERVQACEGQHGMKIASEKSESLETAATNSVPGKTIDHISFRSCAWPRSNYADADGYLEIKVQSVDGPGESEASGANVADRIAAPCKRLTVAYQFGSQQTYENQTPLTITADTVVTVDGQRWTNENGALPFYPDVGEFVVLHNDHYMIQSANCL